jgi:para-nitrobenzyl esterase
MHGAVIAGAALALIGTAYAGGMVVNTATGSVRGVEVQGVDSFKGIPFAAPPVGPLRWRAPQPAASWEGIRDASTYEHDCMQLPFPDDSAPLATTPAEDCLYLNVWRPQAAKRRLPVLVWIYGGGFVNGGSSPPTYSGAELAKQGIIIVSFNYRLGRFGTFAHPLLTKADADAGLLGNYGYMDQLAALKWVQRNIGAFGGDPRDVTIVGESAGGMSVHTLVTSPLSVGLFNRAVIQSGGDGTGMGVGNLSMAEGVGITFASSKNIAEDDPQALEKLRALSAEEITGGLNLATLFQPGPRTVMNPFVDGRLAVDVNAAYIAGQFRHVPLMLGATSDDIGGETGTMMQGARDLAGVIADRRVPVYYYRFSYVAESMRTSTTTGASHASDIPFFFNTVNVKYGDATTAKDRGVGKIMSAYLVNFVKTGDPNGSGLSKWRPYTKSNNEMLDFSADGTALLR